MKLYIPPVVVVALAAFLYTNCVLVRASEHGQQKLSKAKVTAVVAGDASKVKDSALAVAAKAKEAAKNSKAEYKTND